jgi:hypothetical protein
MPNEDAGKEAEAHTLQETARNLEEKIFDAKDATLRLWERNRQLQHRVSGLERRVRGLTWLVLGFALTSAGVLVIIAKSQIFPLQHQVAALQATVSPLQARIEEVAGMLQASAHAAAATSDKTRRQQVEQEVREAVQKLAPALLATAGQESGQESSVTADSGTLVSAAVGTEGSTGAPVRLVVGRTDPHKTPWVQYNHGGIYVDIDTSSAGFTSTPYYFTSLSGHTNNWMAQGVTSIYLPTATGFRVHVGYRELTAAQANSWGWSISWIALGH